jgi:hypothetical protein
MVEQNLKSDYTTTQLTTLAVLRILIGWHLLYEGLSKLFDPYWSSSGYLFESSWNWFRMMATNPFLLSIIDFINIWGLSYTYHAGKRVDTSHLHLKEWLDCIRHGGTPSCPIDKGFEVTIACHMATKSFLEKRRVEWDPVLKRIV